MRRSLLALLALVVIVAACGGASVQDAESALGEESTSTTLSTSTDTGSLPEADTTQADSARTETPDETTTTSDRPVAPDFTLELGAGGEYSLSDGEKPVYLVFWAEW